MLENERANTTFINLHPLDEFSVIEFVSASLCRSREEIVPLAMICFEKTKGNPFFLRQMLELCHRRGGCIWYSWKDSQWQYDLDRISAEFSTEHGQQMDQNFIKRRLQDLPVASRAILAWASLIGTAFSFKLIRQILSGKAYEENSIECANTITLSRPQRVSGLVDGLEAALQAYILVPGSNEDEYRFSHDRYLRAATTLRECNNCTRMHFVIAETLIQNHLDHPSLLYARAEHVLKAIPVISVQVTARKSYRDILSEAACRAVETGARPTALQFLESALSLLQNNAWSIGDDDVDCSETLYLYTKTAELYWSQGRLDDAQALLDTIFASAPEGSNKAAAHIVESRILMQRGDIKRAMTTLKLPLKSLGLQFAFEPTWEICDNEFLKLKESLMHTTLQALIDHPMTTDERLKSMGAVLLEIISAAFWCDSLLFYQLCIHAAKAHLFYDETFPQIGLALAYFAITIVGRDGDISYALRIGEAAKELQGRYGDVYTAARFRAISGLFINHLTSPLRETAEPIYTAIEDSILSGDKHALLSCVGGVGMIKLFSGDNIGEIDSYLVTMTEDYGDYSRDLRGGAFVVGCRYFPLSLPFMSWAVATGHFFAVELAHRKTSMHAVSRR